MLDDLHRHPGEWENHTLDRFLEALAAVLESHSTQDPGWQTVAAALLNASGYE
ncbi:hypothetical protein AB0I28_26420 [Phytomonospora sp. NPDC050363]|uniref:DUF7660 family protein n=1 Tax=Phytomonospora sp. NPDC050363 TaxID=3155642 RepID=UPI0033F7305F